MYNIDVAKNILGVSFNSLSISGTNYLTKNATILPSSFIISSLTSVGTLTSLNITGNTINNEI